MLSLVWALKTLGTKHRFDMHPHRVMLTTDVCVRVCLCQSVSMLEYARQ